MQVSIITMVWSIPAFPWAMEHPQGVPVIQNKAWPTGLADVLNRGGRVYGYWCNGSDIFYFAGNTKGFNGFLEEYATLKGTPLRVVVHPGQGRARRLGGNEEIRYDWEVQVLERGWHPKAPGQAGPKECEYVALVEVWLGGQVQLDGLRVPANVHVESGNEIAGFIAAHQARRAEAEAEGAERAPARRDRLTKGEPANARATAPKPATFKSKRLLYGKVALTEDGSRTLSLVFDESGGTRTGHDLLYCDVNFNGRFEENEKLEGVDVKRYGTWLSTARFAPIIFNVPYNKKAEGIPNPWELTLSYRQYPRAGVAEDFSVVARLKLREGETIWEYMLSGSGRLSKRPEDVELWRMNVAPRMQITTRADERNKGNIGIGLELKVGENEIECRRAAEPIKAHVEIKTPEGTVIHRGDATLDKFVFG